MHLKIRPLWSIDLVRGLKAGGVDVWYSREQLPAGTGYLFDMFNQAIAECDAALIVLTPSYLKSTYAQKELNALHHQHVYADKPIFLLLVGLPAGAILTKYPMISDLYHHRPHASGDMKKNRRRAGQGNARQTRKRYSAFGRKPCNTSNHAAGGKATGAGPVG